MAFYEKCTQERIQSKLCWDVHTCTLNICIFYYTYIFDELSILLVHVLPAPLMWSYQIHGIHNTLPPSYGMFHILCQQQMVGIFFQYAGIFRRCRYSTVGTKKNGKQVNFSSTVPHIHNIVKHICIENKNRRSTYQILQDMRWSRLHS